jgi:hypothetical protein
MASFVTQQSSSPQPSDICVGKCFTAQGMRLFIGNIVVRTSRRWSCSRSSAWHLHGCENGVPAFQRARAGKPAPPQLLV